MKVNTGISITGPSSEEKENVRAKQIKKLKEKEAEFNALGVDIYNIQSETNI